jgi:hypothetical protein
MYFAILHKTDDNEAPVELRSNIDKFMRSLEEYQLICAVLAPCSAQVFNNWEAKDKNWLISRKRGLFFQLAALRRALQDGPPCLS